MLPKQIVYNTRKTPKFSPGVGEVKPLSEVGPINGNGFGLRVLQGTSLASVGGRDSCQVYFYKAAST